MPRYSLRLLALTVATTVLFAAPAVGQEPVDATLPLAEQAADVAAEAAEEAAAGRDDPSSDADTDAPPADEGTDDPSEGGDDADDAALDQKPAPTRAPRSSVLTKGFDGGRIVVKARTKVTQRLLTPAKKGKRAKVLGSATTTARKAGTVRLTIKLNAAGRAFVKAGATKLTLKTVIDPVKGKTRTTTKTITIAAAR